MPVFPRFIAIACHFSLLIVFVHVCPRDAVLSQVPVRSWQEAIWSAVLDEIQQDAEADIDMANS